MDNNRCERIAELLLKESEIYNDFDKIEKELSKLLDIPLGKSLFSERKEK